MVIRYLWTGCAPVIKRYTGRAVKAPGTILLLLLLSGCVERSAWTLAFPGTLPSAIARGEWVRTYPEAAANVGAIFQWELGFTPFTATIQFLPDQRAFEAALVASGYDALLAKQTAVTMAAIGGHHRVLVNEQKLEPLTWPSRIALLAHELTHTFQYELGGGVRGASDQWLREGFAEWATMRVLDRMRVAEEDEYRRLKLRELRSTSRSKAPRLDDMATFRQFVALAGRDDIAPYAQAFVAADLLVERHGLPAIIRYFELFAASTDRVGNFRAAFGEDIATFEAALLTRAWR
jgi:hypothetical protein